MLTDRQLADIQADVTETLTNPKADPSMRLLARHCQYMLDELERLKPTHVGNNMWVMPFRPCRVCPVCMAGAPSLCTHPMVPKQ